MPSTARLQNVQAQVNQRGARVISLGFSPAARQVAPGDLQASVASFFEAYLAGRFHRVEKFGDAPVLPASI